MPELDIQIDRTELDALVAAGVRAISGATAALATVLAGEQIPAEAPTGATGALSEPWPSREVDPVTWVVFPSEKAFYAHMVARGTQAHGSASGRAMPLGGEVYAAHVRGTTANPFHERAIENTEGRVDAVLRVLLADEGIS